MSPALRDYALLWKAAVASRNVGTKWMFRFIGVTFPLIAGLLAWTRTGDLAEGFNYAARVPFAIYLFAALNYYVPGAIRLNTPANARLVPRMHRRLQELTVLAWAGTTVAALVLAWGTGALPALVAAATLAWLVGLGLGSAGYQAGNYLQAAVPGLVIFRQYLPGILFNQTVAVVIGLLLLSLAARALHLMFPDGGDRHWERRRAQVPVIERTTAEGMLRQASNVRHAGRYAAALRRSSTPRRAPAFLLAALDPAIHWTQRLLPLLSAALFGIAALILIKVVMGKAEFAVGWVIGMCQAMVFVQLFTYAQRGQRLADTRGEQSLLRMSPSIPAAARPFNRQLNASLLRVALLDWIVISAALLAVSAFAGANGQQLLLQGQICCLMLPLVSSNVRDHAHAGSSSGLRLAGEFAVALAFSMGVGLVARTLEATAVMPVAAVASVVLAIAVGLWRWRVAVAAPHAFPVGRLAGRPS